MPAEAWLLIFGVLVVLSVALVRRYVVAAAGMGALLLSVIACVLFALVHVYVVDGKTWSLPIVGLLIFAISNLTFQAITKLTGRSL